MYCLKINDEEYLYNSDDNCNKVIETKNGDKILQAFYYGSSSCINSDGLGWFIYIDYHSNITSRKTMKLSLFKRDIDPLKNDILIEEYQLRYNEEKFGDEMRLYNLEGAIKIKGIYMRSLHRFGSPNNMPVEIAGICFEDT